MRTKNQRRADERIPILFELPLKHKGIMTAPLIGPVDIGKYLPKGQIEQVLCGGENYDGSRPCHYEWVKLLYNQCRECASRLTCNGCADCGKCDRTSL